MSGKPNEDTVAAWIGLTRAQRHASAIVEARLKEAGLPPLSWYDALLELERSGDCGLRPFELERATLFEQYNLSRLVDRLAKAGLVERCDCADDRRGQMLVITSEGRKLRKRMWKIYGPAIQEALGEKVSATEARDLAATLRKLA